jgi:hypothetical protein
MTFKPFNRFIQVRPLEDGEQEETPMIILPDDFKAPQSPYLTCEVLHRADNVSLELPQGSKIVVERSMLNEITTNGETIYLVLENYVYGRLEQ